MSCWDTASELLILFSAANSSTSWPPTGGPSGATWPWSGLKWIQFVLHFKAPDNRATSFRCPTSGKMGQRQPVWSVSCPFCFVSSVTDVSRHRAHWHFCHCVASVYFKRSYCVKCGNWVVSIFQNKVNKLSLMTSLSSKVCHVFLAATLTYVFKKKSGQTGRWKSGGESNLLSAVWSSLPDIFTCSTLWQKCPETLFLLVNETKNPSEQFVLTNLPWFLKKRNSKGLHTMFSMFLPFT